MYPKIQQFIWRAISKTNLTIEKIPKSMYRSEYNLPKVLFSAEETINHILFECVHSHAVWKVNDIQQFTPFLSFILRSEIGLSGLCGICENLEINFDLNKRVYISRKALAVQYKLCENE